MGRDEKYGKFILKLRYHTKSWDLLGKADKSKHKLRTLRIYTKPYNFRTELRNHTRNWDILRRAEMLKAEKFSQKLRTWIGTCTKKWEITQKAEKLRKKLRNYKNWETTYKLRTEMLTPKAEKLQKVEKLFHKLRILRIYTKNWEFSHRAEML